MLSILAIENFDCILLCPQHARYKIQVPSKCLIAETLTIPTNYAARKHMSKASEIIDCLYPALMNKQKFYAKEAPWLPLVQTSLEVSQTITI